jgi:medium-chain acyl-[acyl-carrier-protein] hydrolase
MGGASEQIPISLSPYLVVKYLAITHVFMDNKLLNTSEYISNASNLWVSCSKPQPRSHLRLFCFPYAGAGSSTFNSWYGILPSEIELYLVHIPGRDRRVKETPYNDLLLLVESLTEALYPHLDKPFVFYGHSMGGLLSFEVARRLRNRYSLHPVHLFISSHQAPHLPDLSPHLHHLSDEELLRETGRRYGALPDIVLQDPELLKLFLPIMRADFTMVETYQYKPGELLNCPISIFGGKQDSSVNEEELSAWREQTAASFNLKMFEGDHFFIQEKRTELVRAIQKDLFVHWQS